MKTLKATQYLKPTVAIITLNRGPNLLATLSVEAELEDFENGGEL